MRERLDASPAGVGSIPIRSFFRRAAGLDYRQKQSSDCKRVQISHNQETG
jgi:hypothetical protein